MGTRFDREIARDHGFDWESLWELPENSELREARGDPSTLFPGDRVFLPERAEKEEPGQTGNSHRFRWKGKQAFLDLVFLDDNEPRAGEGYTLQIDGETREGTLDGEGRLREPISPAARTARLRLEHDDEEITLHLGTLDPVTEISGIQGRLNNLGIPSGPNDNVLGEKTRAAIRTFQVRHDLEATGEPNEATRGKIQEIHGS